MADDDPLVRVRKAAFACNDAAKNTLEFLQWLNREQPSPFSVFALPFPRGQVLHGRPGEPAEEALKRDGPRLWADTLQTAVDGWKAAVWPSQCLDHIKQAAVSLRLPPLQIGIDSFSTAHEAAYRRACELLYFLQGQTQAVPDEIRLDHRGRIEQEYREAARLQSGLRGDDDGNLIERLLAGPDGAELTPRELALLEAHLKQPISLSAIQQEKRATGKLETNEKRNKLKLILDFDRNLQAANLASMKAAGGSAETNKTTPPKRRGRKKADYVTEQKEAGLAADWERARNTGTCKGDFARDNGMKVADLDRLLERVAKRKKPSE